ncbi:MAG: glycosyl hydrolase [Thermoguttaceae bacterium]
MRNLRRLLLSLAVCLLVCPVAWSAAAELDQGFRQPADQVKPWVYWWWVNGNVTESAITRDLEEMKRQGAGGLLMFDARGYHDDHTPPPPAPMEFMSPEWRRKLKFAMGEANRLGLQMSVNLSSCAGALRGPWNVGDDAPKKLVWAKSEIEGGKRVTCDLPRGEWGRFWEVAVVAARQEKSASGTPTAVEVVDLTDKVDAQQKLAWDAPAGQWTVLRFACEIIAGHENDVDILSPSAVEAYFNRMGRALLEDAGPLAGKTLTHLYSVSWEGATPTWTLGFDKYFQTSCAYDLRPYLPILAGMPVKSPAVTERFLRDYHKTLAECFKNHCYGTLQKLCHKNGLKWHSESGGPWDRKNPSFKDGDQLAFLAENDMPQGEYWVQDPKVRDRGQMMNRPPAMTAHIYGKPLAAVEAFTHMRPHWSVYPAILKPGADIAFCDGINQLIWHTFTCSPVEFGKPGIEYFAGTHFNPNVTWWEQGRAILAYLARCQFMLRQGQFVADVCVYTGDKPYLHWGRGARWSAKSSLTLGKGYTFDLLNTQVLLERLSVKDGRLVLPDGMSYRLLVVDLEDETVPPQALRKVIELAKQGATVVLGKNRPTRAPGLTAYPNCDDDIRRMADDLWASTGRRTLGQGKILNGVTVDETLAGEKIAPDFDGPWDYTHRRDGELDIYFVSGRNGTADCTFRTTGKEPELWDPITGLAHEAVCYRTTDDGRTIVPLRLAENGSVFVVFRKPAAGQHLVSVPASSEVLQIAGRTEGGARLRLWQPGRYQLDLSQSKTLKLDVTGIPEAKTLDGAWEVRFTKGWGAPESVVFDRLLPWDEHPVEGIKYFSGTGTYRKSFDLDAAQAKGLVRLQLGEVKYVADVRVNGKPLGVVWTDPWSVDLTGMVKAGKNDLEIDVSNLWVNRLIGDARIPEESKRLTKTNARRDPNFKGRLAHLHGYLPTDRLVPSGLLGPVRLEFGQEQEVRF